MNNRMRILIFIFFCATNVAAQIGTGQWRLHMSATKAIDVVAKSDRVFTAYQNGITEYGYSSNELSAWNAVSGLSDITVTCLGNSTSNDALFVGYENGNLDKIKNTSSKVSSFLTIQEGCDKFCSFCVVPYTRGPEYSRPFEKIILEAQDLIKSGAKEIILLGQNVNAYSFEGKSKVYRLSDLINELEKFTEIKRIRYTTSHPRDMTDDLIECYSNSKKLQPFVHLPIQSGSDKVLKLMNRGHKVEKYFEIHEKLKKINSTIKFSSDFIIGHPGETEKDFNDTLNFLNEIKFINSYSFIFSPRPGTPASNLDLIDHEVAKDRLIKVQKILFQYQLEHNESFLGKKIDVLVENKMKKNQMYFGRNKYLNGVIFDGNDKLIGQTVKIKIDKVNQNNLFGKIDSNSDMKAA